MKKKPFMLVPPRLAHTAYLAMGMKPPRKIMEKEIDYLEYELNKLRENKWVKRLIKWKIIKT